MDEREMKRRIREVSQKGIVDSLMLMLTYNCQLDCGYCGIAKSQKSMTKEVYAKAITLLLTSKSDEVQLRLWGGEPLLHKDLLEIMELATQLADKAGKKIKFMITTNGLLLSKVLVEKLSKFRVELMISLDGDLATMHSQRAGKGPVDYERIIAAIQEVEASRLPYFINMAVGKSHVKDMVKNFHYLAKSGVRKIQVSYSSGDFWDNDSLVSYMRGLREIKEFCEKNGVFLMNLQNNCEPVMLSDEIICDTDGKLYYDIAMFLEMQFPRLRETVYLGSLSSIKNLQELFHTKEEILDMLLLAYPAGSEKRNLILENLRRGLVVKESLETTRGRPTESRRMPQFLSADIKSQLKLGERLGIKFDSYILHITNSCVNECIFCKNKEVLPTPPENAILRFEENQELGLKKMSIVGNEPLNHPDILQIMAEAKKRGFVEFEIMTSGSFVADKQFLKELYSLGARSFSIPIYSLDPRKHDAIVGRKGDFELLMKGISNIKEYSDINIYLHTNALIQNLSELMALESFVRKTITKNFAILPLRSKDSNLRYKDLLPSYSSLKEALVGSEALVGFPLCVTTRVQKNPLPPADTLSDGMKVYLLDQNFVKPKKCAGCRALANCLGTFKEYIEIYGDGELCRMN